MISQSKKPLPSTIQEIPSSDPIQQDSLIAKGWQREQYIGIGILAIALIAAIGYFSRQFAYALLFAFTLSIILIVFL
ncbi:MULTISPECIES: hypothetical protein [unclassified Nodularia (in: cyanobacteria)]|uniref:hypothetical protein n=1 Tax=unclassified Nodularia (in: cyanobacteria) TaxID=2656917 RepID=UPI0018829D78|nr:MULTISPECIES: hypothetical protein [unclassified Nodularia (in: cyanobacteria)]MBE9197589.1 hypothetical protein [Nodularia sp. LEGE 06071]MCC2692094.1 hypothetical protein [Nodularia sp. LEGE 04288]